MFPGQAATPHPSPNPNPDLNPDLNPDPDPNRNRNPNPRCLRARRPYRLVQVARDGRSQGQLALEPPWHGGQRAVGP